MNINPTQNIKMDKSYIYIDDDELQKDFISGINLNYKNIPSIVYFYFYNITELNSRPYLKILLDNKIDNENLLFPSIQLNKDDVLTGIETVDIEYDLNDIFLDACINKITTEQIENHENVIINNLYKGFITYNNKLFLVFCLKNENIKSLSLQENFSVCVIDEILNKQKKIINDKILIIDKSVYSFFNDNLYFLYIINENLENLEIPYIFYGKQNIQRTIDEYGFFYKLSKEKTNEYPIEYIAFIEERTYYKNQKIENYNLNEINKEFNFSIIINTEKNLWYFKNKDDFSIL